VPFGIDMQRHPGAAERKEAEMGAHVIQVELPDWVEPTPEDLEVLHGIFDAIVSLRFGPTHTGEQVVQALKADGWDVRSRLAWVAEARKGGEYEQVTGASNTAALVHLDRLVKADRVMSAP
jgi:hypothetical protein